MEDLTEKELAVFKELYSRIDIEGAGEFSYRELGIVLRALGCVVSDSELHNMINESDANGNGALNFEEFVNTLLRRLTDTDHPDDLKMVFNVFDKEKNGCISTSDLRKIFGSIGIQPGEDELEDMIRQGDTDGDGVLMFEEFVGMLTSGK